MFFLASLAFAADPPADAVADAATPEAAPAEGAAAADAVPADAAAPDGVDPQLVAFDRGLTRRTGDVTLQGGKAVLHVPDTFAYVGPEETDRILQAWGNPASPDTLGMLLPAGAPIYGEQTWAVIISYSDDGHVDDDDAAGTDWNEVLGQMKEAAAADSEARVKAGLGSVALAGWAEPPRYDATTHKIYWAKDLVFDGGDHTLNYAIRVLGRAGVLEFNAVAAMDQLGAIKAPMEQVVAFSEFTDGNRYEQFDGSTDKLAAYGVAALVAGGVAAKTGLFKGLIAALIAGKKLVAVAVVAVAGFVKRLFGGKPEPK